MQIVVFDRAPQRLWQDVEAEVSERNAAHLPER